MGKKGILDDWFDLFMIIGSLSLLYFFVLQPLADAIEDRKEAINSDSNKVDAAYELLIILQTPWEHKDLLNVATLGEAISYYGQGDVIEEFLGDKFDTYPKKEALQRVIENDLLESRFKESHAIQINSGETTLLRAGNYDSFEVTLAETTLSSAYGGLYTIKLKRRGTFSQ